MLYQENSEYLSTVAKIVSAYVSKNPGSTEDLVKVIRVVFDSLKSVAEKLRAEAEAEATVKSPAVPVDQSVKPDAIVCLIPAAA
jgi:predicted transcriptional regulator